VAIVLRGPTGVGKSTIRRALTAQINRSVAEVSLDRGWAGGEARFVGPHRYEDLRVDAAVLLIELALGEPAGFPFPGATLNPRGWLEVLEQCGREIFLFLVWAERTVTLKRTTERGTTAPGAAAWVHGLYDGGLCSKAAFGSRLGGKYEEVLLDATTSAPASLARAILQTTKVRHDGTGAAAS
jgi:hypothetical protein